MMKNDLDFIKDKIENSGVKAPEDMDETFVMDTLEEVYPKLTAVEQPKKKRRGWKIALSATAAALALTVTFGVIGANSTRTLDLPGGLSIRQFRTHAQVENEIKSIRKKDEQSGLLDYFTGRYKSGGDTVEDYALDGDYYAAEENASAKTGSSGASGSSTGSAGGGLTGGSSDVSYSETYKQVENVDEADIIKTDGRYIYCVDQNYSYENYVVIFSADGANAKRVAVIDVTTQKAATEDEKDRNDDTYYGYGAFINEIYLREDRLIVLSSAYGNTDVSDDATTVQVYDISDIDSITLLDSMTQSGSYDASRMIGDTLYTVSSYSPYGEDVIPKCGRGEKPDTVPANCIYSPPGNDSENFLVLSSYDTIDYTARTESKAILGAVDDLYCNENHMYIYTTEWGDAEEDDSYAVTSRILKVDLTDGIEFTAYAGINGQIDDQYALDESDGNLRVATTSYENGRDANNLFVLDENLSMIGSVTGFAENESIKAVRYLGNTAYVITYEQTDPLFVIDLSVPTAPAILGEVKISGFSTMLVPIDENTLLGLGYHTENEDYTDMEVQEGFKLALFDISDKTDPKVLDSKSYVDCCSEVQYNPKVLVYNPERDDYIIPLNYAHWGSYDAKTQEFIYDEEYYGGVLNFKVENGKLVEIDRTKADCETVNRCVYVGDNIYMIYYDGDADYELQIACVPYK